MPSPRKSGLKAQCEGEELPRTFSGPRFANPRGRGGKRNPSGNTGAADALPRRIFEACPQSTVRVCKGLSVKVRMAADADGFLEHYAKISSPDAIPYYAILWEASRPLAAHLATGLGDKLRGKSVVELGCGMGVPSIVAAKLGADVTATDYHPDSGAFFERNAALNGVDARFMSLDWRNLPGRLPRCDYVIASDVLYRADWAPHLVRAATRLLRDDGRLILADLGRSGFQPAVDLLQLAGWRLSVTVAPSGVFILAASRR